MTGVLKTKEPSETQRREALVLIAAHLQSEGYHDVHALLQQQAPVLAKHSLADNLDLSSIIVEWSSSYKARLGRAPVIISRQASANKSSDCADGSTKGSASRKKQAVAARRRAAMQYGGASGKEGGDFGQQSAVLKQMENRLNDVGDGGQQGSARVATADALEAANNENDLAMTSITGQSISALSQQQETEMVIAIENRLLKPLPTFNGDLELQALARSIQHDIVQTDTGVGWDDIIGLDDPKRLLKEAVVAPLLYPGLFTGLLAPWSGCLLFGPPGTGKTLLARAVAAQTQSTFFNISASSITSKFRGDSEKLVRILFDLARHHAPSVVFFDEIDSILGSRSSFGGDGGGGGDCAGGGGGGGVGEHEGSRRTKAELLVQMDGLSKSDDHVFVLAASNLPWQLDPALLRRLDKRVLVPLPAEEARAGMLRSHLATLPAHTCREADLAECARATEGYSGADIRLLSKEAAMRPVRRVLASIEEEESRRTPGVPALSDQDVAGRVRRNPVTSDDLRDARRSTSKSCGSMFGERYERWMREYGSA